MDKILAQYHISNILTGDVIFFLILAVIGAGLGFLMGRYRLVALLASVYFSAVIFSVFPATYLPKDPVFVLFFFSALVVALTFLDEYLFDVNGEVSETMWKGVVVGFFAVGAYVSTAVALVPWATVSDILSKQTYGYFAGPWARVFWMVAPLVFFFLVKKKWK